MKASQITAHANNLTDENLDFQTLLGFINDGIAEINAEMNAKFPFMTTNDEEIPFPETWQRTVLVPYVAAKIKQKDSSQFEYNDLYGQFSISLVKMAARYTIPDEYLNTEASSSIAPDFTGHFNNWG